MDEEELKICRKCIIPDSFPDVEFEEEICEFCKNYPRYIKNHEAPLGKEKLKKVLLPNKEAKYDCLVPLSGGKDSSFILYYLVKNLGLNPLAAFFDSGFSTEYGKKNVRNLCEKLSVDLVVGTASEYRWKIVKEHLKLAKHRGRIGYICANCENNLRSFVIKTAFENKIPYVVWGATDFEELFSTFLQPEAPKFQEDFGKRNLTKFFIGLKNGFKNLLKTKGGFKNKAHIIYHSLKILFFMARDNMVTNPQVGLKKINPYFEVSFDNYKIKPIYFFKYIAYDPIRNIEALKKEMGWEAPDGKEIRSDCLIHHIANYQHFLDTGITQDGFNLSVLVRSKQLSQQEALRRENIIIKDIVKDCQKSLEILGETVEDFFSDLRGKD